MNRFLSGLAVLLCLVSTLSASLSSRKENSPNFASYSEKPLLTMPVENSPPSSAPNEFQLTATSEILLDGKPCKYEQVPGNATVIKLEVASDRKTILKVYFRRK